MPTPTKLPVCCSRVRAKLIMDEANLRTLAQKTAKRAEKGLSIVYLQSRIADVKATIEQSKQAIIDHDADHAGERR
jgi:hypothetical protein